MIRALLAAALLTSLAWGQATEPAKPETGTAGAGQLQQPANSAQQMRLDLNQMDSLLNNMSSEVTFLRDQNLQILLNTNVRMWRMLIQDLRLQLEEQERQGKPPQPRPTQPR